MRLSDPAGKTSETLFSNQGGRAMSNSEDDRRFMARQGRSNLTAVSTVKNL
jgi:hypothetical protein